MPSAIQFPHLRPINAIKNVASSVRSVDGPSFPEVHHGRDTPRLPVLPLCLSRTEQLGTDTVPQPDLYSGQAVYYIKKVMGLCKSTCPTFLPNFLKPSTTSERQIRLAVGRGEEVCAQTLQTSTRSFKGCFHRSCPPTPLSTQLRLQYIFLYHTCLISSCVIPPEHFENSTRSSILIQHSQRTVE